MPRTTPKPLHHGRRRGAVFATALLAAGAIAVIPAGAAFADGTGEFEAGYIYPEANGNFPADAAASGGAASEMWDASSNDLSVNNSTATVAYKIRAKQVQCGPAASQMRLTVDGVVAGTAAVTADTWTDYTFSGSWAPGWRLLHVEFVNPYFGDCGARELFLDKVTAVSPVAATTRTFYVDAAAGSDTNNGTSATTAWKTVGKVQATTLKPGDTVLFKRGQTFTNPALIARTAGTAAARITYGSYGTGALPTFDGAGTSTGGGTVPISVQAAFVTVQDIHVGNGGGRDKIGLDVAAPDALVQRVTATGNAIGVQAEDAAARLRVTGSTLNDNKIVINPDGKGAPISTDDYGASGVVVLATDGVEIDNNTFTGNYGKSADFGYDGSAVEIFGATNTVVHHNTATDNQTFSELGDVRTNNTTFYDNLITTTASLQAGIVYGINVQGSDGGYGPVAGTKIYNNTIVLKNAGAGGLDVGPDSTVSLHNNVIQAESVGYTENTIDEGHNVYYGNGSATPYNRILSSANAAGGIAASSTTANPLFVGATDYRLQTGSPAKDRGVSNYSITTDLDGKPRTYGPGTDAGAYERQTS